MKTITEKNRAGVSTSKEIAKERLKNILLRDRVDIAPNIMQMVKDDMINVAGEYFNVGEKDAEIYLTGMKKPESEMSETYLVCLIPVFKL